MKKVAIITHYWESINYGGNLQAYALTLYLNNNGYQAKQIRYSFIQSISKKQILKRAFSKGIFKGIHFVLNFFYGKVKIVFNHRKFVTMKSIDSKRKNVFTNFQLQSIPHTEKIYTDASLAELNDFFDAFITGSDQVFNFDFFREGFFLNFVDCNKCKFSYAASMALNDIPQNRKEYLTNSLSKFDAISVREEKTVELLKKYVSKKIELSIDPTFLLDLKDWDAIANKRLIDEEYIFCYFIGDNKYSRKMANSVSDLKNMKIASIPMCKNKYMYYDLKFGDFVFESASPEDFISLIKNASFVITDSFHASVFSIIYNKQFVVLDRDIKGSMNSRIVSLLRLFKIENRYMQNSKLSNVKSIQFELEKPLMVSDKEFYELKIKSILYLKRNLLNE